MRATTIICAAGSAAFVLSATSGGGQTPGSFQLVASAKGVGGLTATAVGPGPQPGTQRIYGGYSYSYLIGRFDLLSVDPRTGNSAVFQSPVPGEGRVESMAVGPDGNIYIGTSPNAHLMEFDTRQERIYDLGRPSPTENYIWGVAFGSDHRLYGVTYPRAKLVRYDLATRRMEDLGTLDPGQLYARSIAASQDGFVYAGIGTQRANIAAFNIRTGQHQELLSPTQTASGFGEVFEGDDGNIYGRVGTHLYRLKDWTATEVRLQTPPAKASKNTLPDGTDASLEDDRGTPKLKLSSPTQAKEPMSVSYSGKELGLARIGFGPDHVLYASTLVPFRLLRVDMAAHKTTDLGELGKGEVYSFLSADGRLEIAAYAATSTLMSYRPDLPIISTGKLPNPTAALFPGGGYTSLRPMAMIEGPDGNVYVGSVPGYGELGSILLVWNIKTNTVQRIDGVLDDESVVSLAIWKGLIVGGASISGGPGSHPTQKDAKLFIWDPKSQKTEYSVVPVPGAPSITDLVTAPDGLVYGIAGQSLFAFDPAMRKVVVTQQLPFSDPVYNSAALDSKGRIWGLTKKGIFMVDPVHKTARLIANSPADITGGFAMDLDNIYFIVGSSIYSYRM